MRGKSIELKYKLGARKEFVKKIDKKEKNPFEILQFVKKCAIIIP